MDSACKTHKIIWDTSTLIFCYIEHFLYLCSRILKIKQLISTERSLLAGNVAQFRFDFNVMKVSSFLFIFLLM